MAFARLFAGRPAVTAGRRLYLEAVEQARRPVFYTRWGVPDTADGRFELYSAHVILLLNRLKHGGPAAEETAQGLFDAYVKALDDAMREAGVGDLSVGKKVRKLGSAFMGRIKGYDAAFAALPDTGELRSLIARTTYEGDEAAAAPLTAYAAQANAGLAGQPIRELLKGRAAWPEVA